jgi:hypothetical protein
MDRYIHLANLAFLKKKNAEEHDAEKRDILLMLLADEKAKEPPRRWTIWTEAAPRWAASVGGLFHFRDKRH